MDSNVVSIHPTKERSSFFPSLMRLERFKSNRQNSQVFPESYSLLLNAIQDFANFKLDVSGLVSTWNSGGKRILRYPKSDILGEHFSCFFAERDNVAEKPDRLFPQRERMGRAVV